MRGFFSRRAPAPPPLRYLHVVPPDDLIEHTLTDRCICGPTLELTRDNDGEDAGWVISHASLDGREHREDQEPGWALMEADG